MIQLTQDDSRLLKTIQDMVHLMDEDIAHQSYQDVV